MAFVRGVIAASSFRRVHRQRGGLDVHENRARSDVTDRRNGGDEGKGNGDDLIARSDACRQQRQVKRAGAGIDRDGMLRAAIGGELFFERCHLFSQDVLRGSKHVQDGGIDFRLDGGILRLQIEERDHATRLTCSSSITRPRWLSD